MRNYFLFQPFCLFALPQSQMFRILKVCCQGYTSSLSLAFASVVLPNNVLSFLSRTKPRETSFSNSSLSSCHNKGSHRKRSPSHEEDCYRIKRQRHDSESNKMSGNFMESHQNGTLSENGVDATDSSLKPQECSCNGRSNIDKREADIARLYDPEPRV